MNMLPDRYDYTKKKGYSAQKFRWMPGNDHRKKTRVGRNRAFKDGLCEGANIRHLRAVLLTLTYEEERERTAFSCMRYRLSEKFSKISQQCHRYDIPNMGIKAVEKHQDGTPHIHLLTFLKEQDIERYLDIVRRYFPSPVNQNEKALQTVARGEEKQAGNYLIKIDFLNDDESLMTRVSEASEISYFGIRKGILSCWDAIYREKRPLSNQESIIHRHIRDGQYHSALVMLNAFEPFDKWVKQVDRKKLGSKQRKSRHRSSMLVHEIAPKKVHKRQRQISRDIRELQETIEILSRRRKEKKAIVDVHITETVGLEKLVRQMIKEKQHCLPENRDIFFSRQARLMEIGKANFSLLNDIKKVDCEIERIRRKIDTLTQVKIITTKTIGNKWKLPTPNKVKKPYGKGNERYWIKLIPRKNADIRFWSRGPPDGAGNINLSLICQHFLNLKEIFMHNAKEETTREWKNESVTLWIRGPPKRQGRFKLSTRRNT